VFLTCLGRPEILPFEPFAASAISSVQFFTQKYMTKQKAKKFPGLISLAGVKRNYTIGSFLKRPVAKSFPA